MDTSSAYWYTLLINLYYFFISGALASSVFKKISPAAKLFGLPAWLAIHEVIGILILLFTIAATAVIFIAKQNFLNDPHVNEKILTTFKLGINRDHPQVWELLYLVRR